MTSDVYSFAWRIQMIPLLRYYFRRFHFFIKTSDVLALHRLKYFSIFSFIYIRRSCFDYFRLYCFKYLFTIFRSFHFQLYDELRRSYTCPILTTLDSFALVCFGYCSFFTTVDVGRFNEPRWAFLEDCRCIFFNDVILSFFCRMPTTSDVFASSHSRRLRIFFFICIVSNTSDFLDLLSCPRWRASGFFRAYRRLCLIARPFRCPSRLLECFVRLSYFLCLIYFGLYTFLRLSCT